MSQIEIIEVTTDGDRLDGSPLLIASREAVKAGFMVNVPVVLRYPDGRMIKTHEGRITPKGLAVAAQEMGRDQPRH